MLHSTTVEYMAIVRILEALVLNSMMLDFYHQEKKQNYQLLVLHVGPFANCCVLFLCCIACFVDVVYSTSSVHT